MRRAGIEGTGSYGAGLARHLILENIEVFEITRPSRRGARHLGKTDQRDAVAAAKVVLSGEATAVPKPRDGIVESIRVLRNTRASAVKARTQTGQQLRSLVITASTEVPDSLSKLSTDQTVAHCARWHRVAPTDTACATRLAMRVLARRHQTLDDEITELDTHIKSLTATAAPRLLAERGVGPETAARLLIVAGDNPDRLRSDAALAALCGASPVKASSGKSSRHHLNRGGDRQGNNALWTIATSRMIHDPELGPTSNAEPRTARAPRRSAAA